MTAELTFCPRITRRTLADEPVWHIAGNSTGTSVLTRLPRTHIYHTLAVTTSKSTATDARIIIYQLNTIQTSTGVTRIREAFVDIPLASLACKAWEANTAIAPDLVDALPSVEAAGYSRVRNTVIHVLLTEATPSAWWTGALEMVDEVYTRSSILAGLELALIHFIFTVDTLVSRHTLALVSTQVIPAGGTILARAGLAFIQLILTVAARVTHAALTAMCVPNIQAMTRVLAQLIYGDSPL